VYCGAVRALTQIDLRVPVEAAFTYYCDQARLQEWIPGGGILEFTPLDPPPKQVGSRYRIAYRSFGLIFRLIARVTQLEKDRLSVKELVSGDYKTFRYEMRFARVDSTSSHLEMRVMAELPWGPFGEVMLWLVGPLIRRDLGGGLTRFKARVEATASAPAVAGQAAG
jgi:hypothetical protein